ncbi:MAG: extracellular solute-binding protein [Deltaproteobacteria bacterium]|nr:extracellular solute-binding protein [Deltaproteobacteria bacterium]
MRLESGKSRRTVRFVGSVLSSLVLLVAACSFALAQQAEWDKTVAEAKKEGKVVVGLPPSAELRKELEPAFKNRFGIEMEIFSATGPQIANRIVTEGKAGVRYFDSFIFGSCTGVPLIKSGMFDPIEPYMILPEVKEAKNWWGGHIFMDNVSGTKLFYSFISTKSTEGYWHNTSLSKAEEFRSLDDLLNPKWKGKIGLSDPRVAGSGLSVWSYLWDLKGEEFLRKLVAQDLFVTQNLRQLAEALAKGKLAITLGIGLAQIEPFVKAGLPVKDLPDPIEGNPSSNGYGTLAIVKNPPHPNATKVFVNWLLSKEGQEIYSRVLLHGTRRLDVDTKWMAKQGVEASKDFLSVKDNERLRNYLEDKCVDIRLKSQKFAEKILQ